MKEVGGLGLILHRKMAATAALLVMTAGVVGCGYTINVTPNDPVVTATATTALTPACSAAASKPSATAPLESESAGAPDSSDRLTRDVCDPELGALPDLIDTSDNGYYVEVIQEVAQSFGLDPGPVDGQYGPRTIAAVRELQAIVGADVDGQVGPQTWGALRSVFCPPLSNGGGAALPNLMTEDDLIATIQRAFPDWALEGVPPSDLSSAESSWYASSPEMVLELSGAVVFAFLYPAEGSVSPSEIVYLDTTMRNVSQTFPLVSFDRIQCGNSVFITRIEARRQFEQALPPGITCQAT